MEVSRLWLFEDTRWFRQLPSGINRQEKYSTGLLRPGSGRHALHTACVSRIRQETWSLCRHGSRGPTPRNRQIGMIRSLGINHPASGTTIACSGNSSKLEKGSASQARFSRWTGKACSTSGLEGCKRQYYVSKGFDTITHDIPGIHLRIRQQATTICPYRRPVDAIVTSKSRHPLHLLP